MMKLNNMLYIQYTTNIKDSLQNCHSITQLTILYHILSGLQSSSSGQSSSSLGKRKVESMKTKKSHKKRKLWCVYCLNFQFHGHIQAWKAIQICVYLMSIIMSNFKRDTFIRTLINFAS